ncbi:MAG: sigma-70 family RNA polymerase sigma factor [bacterium]|nr:sigma-70 family RNA polymerase sigma factor [bacterium]
MQAVKDPGCGHEEAIERMVNEWQLPLLRLCYIQLRDQGLAEDAVQETFLKAFRGIQSFRGECSEKTWLTRIAVNTCRDMQRGGWFRHIDRRVTLDMLPEAASQPPEEYSDLTLAVINLPRKYREAMMLYYYQDMDTAEIGMVLGIAQSTVSNRLRKGRELLRKTLERRDPNA